MNTDAIRKAIDVAGGQTALAHALDRSQGLVWQWAHGRLRVPAEKCSQIEQTTGVTRHELRPDIFANPTKVEET